MKPHMKRSVITQVQTLTALRRQVFGQVKRGEITIQTGIRRAKAMAAARNDLLNQRTGSFG